MKQSKKHFFKRVLAVTLTISLVLSLFVLSGNLFPDIAEAQAAESSVMGEANYHLPKDVVTSLVVGDVYTFGGHEWVVTSVPGTSGSSTSWPITLTSTGMGITHISDWTNVPFYSRKTNTASWTETGAAIYEQIKDAVAPGQGLVAPGQGFYIADNYRNSSAMKKAFDMAVARYGTEVGILKSATLYNNTDREGEWYDGLVYWYVQTAPGNYSILDFRQSGGTVTYNDTIYQKFDTYKSIGAMSVIYVPSFDLDLTKVTVCGHDISLGNSFVHSTAIGYAQNIASVEEGSTVNLADVISQVTYSDGTNAGNTASYVITASAGSISGTVWTAPTNVNQATPVTLTVREIASGLGLTTTATVTVTPVGAQGITVVLDDEFPVPVVEGQAIDFADYINVCSYDLSGNSDGTITNYTLEASDGHFSGTTYSIYGVSEPREVTITVTANETLGTTSYAGMTTTFRITVASSAAGWTERDDDAIFQTYYDEATGITWYFKCNNKGQIQYLYTEDDISNIISAGHVLLVPSTVNDIPVVAIGGGNNDGKTIPFVPAYGDNAWTSIYFPNSITAINDGAFMYNTSEASVVIPGTITKIGVRAFNGSAIKSVTFNEAERLDVADEAFADCYNLTDIIFRGSGVNLGTRSFANATALTSLNIPNGTEFHGTVSTYDSYAFEGAVSLRTLVIDTDSVEGNTFSGLQNLSKVVFGENVSRIAFDWAGTYDSNIDTVSTTVNRTTYVLNEECIIEIDKIDMASPFGYAGNLTVVGKAKDYSRDSRAYNAKSDIVTAKVCYLADKYATDATVKAYAKGAAADITITSVEDPSAALTGTTIQTGIEAYYDGSIFNGRNLIKDKMTVYKMFGQKQDGTYLINEYYVLRTNDADNLLFKRTSNDISGSNYVAMYADDEIAAFKAKDTITVTDADLAAGSVDVKVVVLKKDALGNILVDHETGYIQAWTATVAVPVKAYTAADDFAENYGSYAAVIEKIAELESHIDEWKTQIAELTGLSTESLEDAELVKAELDKKQAELAAYRVMYNDLVVKLNDLLSTSATDSTGYIIIRGTTEYVYINGNDVVATDTGATTADGKTIYEANGDIGNGSQRLTFWVDGSGVHIIKVDGVTQTPEILVSDSLAALQRSITAQVDSLATELGSVNDNLDDLYDDIYDTLAALSITTDDLDDGASSAEKMEAIADMVKDITDSLYDLKSDYDALGSNYQNIIDAVYGEGQKTASEVTSADIVAQLERNEQSAIAEAVNEALAASDDFETHSAAVQQTIASTIDKILENESVNIDDLSPELKVQLEAVKALKAAIESMQQGNNAYASFLQTLGTALEIGSTADSAQILAGIQSLKDQVTDLTAKNNELAGKVTDLTAEKTTSYNEGYSAGIAAAGTSGGTSGSGTAKGSYTKEDLDKKYREGVKYGANLVNEEYEETIALLQNQVDQLTKERTALNTKLSRLSTDTTDSYNEGYQTGFVEGQKKGNTVVVTITTTPKPAATSKPKATSTPKPAATNTPKPAATEEPSIPTKAPVEQKEDSTYIPPTPTPADRGSSNDSIYISGSDKVISVGYATQNGFSDTNDKTALVNAKLASNPYSDTQTSAYMLLDASEAAKLNAQKWLELLATNPEYLLEIAGGTNRETLAKVLDNRDLGIAFEAIMSADVVPGSGERDLNVKFLSDKIVDGDMYLTIHESSERKAENGTPLYDLQVMVARDNAVTAYLQDFSPVTLVHINVLPIAEIAGIKAPKTEVPVRGTSIVVEPELTVTDNTPKAVGITLSVTAPEEPAPDVIVETPVDLTPIVIGVSVIVGLALLVLAAIVIAKVVAKSKASSRYEEDRKARRDERYKKSRKAKDAALASEVEEYDDDDDDEELVSHSTSEASNTADNRADESQAAMPGARPCWAAMKD